VKEVQEVNLRAEVPLQEVGPSLQRRLVEELPAEALRPEHQHQEEVPVAHLPEALLQMKEVQYQEDQVLHAVNLLQPVVSQLLQEAEVPPAEKEVPQEVQLQEVQPQDAVPLLTEVHLQEEVHLLKEGVNRS
jgi:hypothetical protein